MTDHLSRYVREEADKIQHLTLAPTYQNGRRTWQGSCKRDGSSGYIVAYHDDPAQALAQSMFIRRNGLPIEPGVLYWHHPESGSIFKTYDDDPLVTDESRDPCLEEIDRVTYFGLCLQYGIIDEPMPLRKSVAVIIPEPVAEPDDDLSFLG